MRRGASKCQHHYHYQFESTLWLWLHSLNCQYVFFFSLSLNFISLQIMRFAEVFNLQLGFHVKLFSIAASICYFFVLSLICLILRILSGWSHDVDKFKCPFLSSSSQHCNFNEFEFVIKCKYFHKTFSQNFSTYFRPYLIANKRSKRSKYLRKF